LLRRYDHILSTTPHSNQAEHREAFKSAVQTLSSNEMRDDELYRVIKAISRVLSSKLGNNELFWVCQMLLRISTSASRPCIQAAACACEALIQEKAAALGFGVERLLIALLVALRNAANDGLEYAEECFQRSVVALAKHHLDLVAQALLNTPRPLSAEARTIVTAIVGDGAGIHVKPLVQTLVSEAGATESLASEAQVGLLAADKAYMALSVLDVVMTCEAAAIYIRGNYAHVLGSLLAMLGRAHATDLTDRLELITSCIRAFFIATKDNEILKAMEATGKWHDMHSAVDYLGAVATMVGSVCCFHADQMAALFGVLGQCRTREPQCLALLSSVASEFVLHCGANAPLLRDVLDVLESFVKDGDCYTCVYALRGLGNCSVLKDQMSGHLSGIMDALVEALSSTVFDEVQAEALSALAKTVSAIDRSVLAPTVGPLAEQLFELLENCVNESVLAAALGLLAHLTDSLNPAGFEVMLHNHLIILLVVLNQRQPAMRKASRHLLKVTAALFKRDTKASADFSALLASSEWDGSKADLESICNRCIPLLVREHPCMKHQDAIRICAFIFSLD
jgi:hypothetical protein